MRGGPASRQPLRLQSPACRRRHRLAMTSVPLGVRVPRVASWAPRQTGCCWPAKGSRATQPTLTHNSPAR